MSMHIFIPTLGRPHKQTTFSELPEDWQQRTSLVVQHHERDLYKAHNPDVDIIALPQDIKTISPTREWIVNECQDEKLIMMDDDIRFNKRREDHEWKLRRTEPRDVGDLLQLIEGMLEEYAHVGVSPREGNNRVKEEVAFNTRYMRILCYQTAVIKTMEHNRVEVMEDFDLNLQLLRAGYENAVIFQYANGQGETNAPGGCSVWRTEDLHNRNAAKLAELHPDFVKLRTNRSTKSGGVLSNRHEVTIQWKKAYQSSQGK